MKLGGDLQVCGSSFLLVLIPVLRKAFIKAVGPGDKDSFVIRKILSQALNEPRLMFIPSTIQKQKIIIKKSLFVQV